MSKLVPTFDAFRAARASRRALYWLMSLAMVCGFALTTFAQEIVSEDAPANEGAVHHSISSHAPSIPGLKIGPIEITNSMIVTWVVALGILIFARIATARMKEVPQGAQNFWEFLVESLHDFLGTIIGPKLVNKTFWFFASIFIFILATNWFGLLPGVGTMGWGVPDATGRFEHFDTPLLRGGNADMNMTLAMSCIFFVCWLVWALQENGAGGFVLHLFGPKGDATGFMKYLMIFVFIIVGVLEVISILFRPVSLSFRLYGNVYAGENMLESMSTMIPSLGWLIPIPFYFMELLVGLVQALVFMLLTAVFTLLICSHDDGPAHH